MIEILKRISGLSVAPVSDSADKQNEILLGELPFKVIKFKSGLEHNGWTVPYKWEVKKALIKKDGKIIYDGTKHPLCVIGSSESFKGKIDLVELKKHLFFKKDAPKNIVYHCDLYYKPFLKNWGFSVPYELYESLSGGEYEIDLETVHEKGEMKVLEYIHKGRKKDTIVFNAHNCHAAQLNDGPSGYVVFIEAMKRLLKMGKTKFSYRLIIAPEHIGTIFYTANLPKKDIKNFKGGIFMEMVGHDNPIFALQESFTGASPIDKFARHVLRHKSAGFWSAPFRKIVGNDETVWEAPGVEIPMISLSRCKSKDFYYPEYHLDSDNIKIIKEDKLEETLKVIMSIIEIFEKNCFVTRKFDGLLALSNPKYDLYLKPGTDPSIGERGGENTVKWNYLMDCIPRYFNGKTSIFEIAERHDLPFNEVYDYVSSIEDKKLVEFKNI